MIGAGILANAIDQRRRTDLCRDVDVGSSDHNFSVGVRSLDRLYVRERMFDPLDEPGVESRDLFFHKRPLLDGRSPSPFRARGFARDRSDELVARCREVPQVTPDLENEQDGGARQQSELQQEKNTARHAPDAGSNRGQTVVKQLSPMIGLPAWRAPDCSRRGRRKWTRGVAGGALRQSAQQTESSIEPAHITRKLEGGRTLRRCRLPRGNASSARSLEDVTKGLSLRFAFQYP